MSVMVCILEHLAITRKCPSPNNPNNGVVNFKEGRKVGAKVWYSCNSGYKLVGSESRICKSDLTWFPKAPFCKRKSTHLTIKLLSFSFLLLQP